MSNNEMPMKQMIESALSKIREVVDVNTVIGDPIVVTPDVTVIPFSKVAVGFASGGSEFGGKNNPNPEGRAYFAGGNGAGVTITPLGFISVEKGVTRVIELGNPVTYSAPVDPVNRALDSINGVISKAPDLIAKIMEIFSQYTSTDNKDNAEVNVDELLNDAQNEDAI